MQYVGILAMEINAVVYKHLLVNSLGWCIVRMTSRRKMLQEASAVHERMLVSSLG